MATQHTTDDGTNERIETAARELRELPEVESVDTSPGGAIPSVRIELADAAHATAIPETVMRETYENGLGAYHVSSGTVSATLRRPER